jgi:glycosyltransferase involved in cell wall biosynthesis
MIVLHLDSEKSWRGGEQQVAYLMEELHSKDVKNIVGCPPNSKLQQYCENNKIPFFTIPYGGTNLKAAMTLKKYCQQHKVDIIHMHSAKAHTVGVYAKVMGNTPTLILSKRTDFPVRNNFLSQFKYNHPAIKKILCVSNKIKEVLDESLTDKNKSITVYSGINPAKFNLNSNNSLLREKFKLADDAIIVGNTSALADHKDYYTFLRTAKKVHEQNSRVHFFIIGNGPMESELMVYVNQHDMSEYVHFTGFLTNLPEVLPTLDIFLMTSKEEGLGTSLLDAMACKVPIVATHAGGIPEIVIHQKTGLVSPIGDDSKLSKELLYLIAHPEKKDELISNAFEMVHNNFHKKITAQQTFEAYQGALQL